MSPAAATETMALPSDLTIYNVNALRSQLLSWIAGINAAGNPAAGAAGRVDIDASAVAEIDAAGVQLILSLSRTGAIYDRRIRLTQPTQTLTDACETLGVKFLLGDPATTGATK